MNDGVLVGAIDGDLVDTLIEIFGTYGQPEMLRLTASLLAEMRDGAIAEGDMLPANGVLRRKDGTSVSAATYAKQLIAGLGLAERRTGGYMSRMKPRPQASLRQQVQGERNWNLMSIRTWEDLPVEVRGDVEIHTGEIVDAESVATSLASGWAAVLHAKDGERWFFKGCPMDSPAAHLYVQEMDANAVMLDGIPAPQMRHASIREWAIMVFDFLPDAASVDLSPGSPDLGLVVDLITAIGSTAAPGGMPVTRNIAQLASAGGRLLGELEDGELRSMYANAVFGLNTDDFVGDRLAHYDLKPGSLVKSGGRLYGVDWAFACAARRGLDALLLVPRLIVAGHTAEQAEKVMSAVPGWGDFPPATITGLAAVWTMYRHYVADFGPPETRERYRPAIKAGQDWLAHRMKRDRPLGA